MRVRLLLAAVAVAIVVPVVTCAVLVRRSVLGEPPTPPNVTSWDFPADRETTWAMFRAAFCMEADWDGSLPWDVSLVFPDAPTPDCQHMTVSDRSGFGYVSPVYRSRADEPLAYPTEYDVRFEARGPAATRAVVTARSPRVVVGWHWWPMHLGKAPVLRTVAATTVEESLILRLVAESVGDESFPSIRTNPDAVAALRGALTASEHAVSAARVLGLVRAREAVPSLCDAVARPDEGAAARDLRPYAAEALGRIGDADSVECLLRGLADSEPAVRRASATALGRMRSRSNGVIEALLGALDAESSPAVRESAAVALGRLHPLPAAATDRLARISRDGREDLSVRIRAAGSLARIVDDRIVHVETVAEALSASWTGDKYYAATTLGDLGVATPGIIGGLRALLRDESCGVRAAARVGLWRLGAR